MNSSQIKGLQRALNAAGFVGADGQPLAVDGDIGPNTEAAIQSALAAAGTVNASSPSELIRAVQGSLNATGATDKNGQPLKVDGRFGPLTESALRKVAPNAPVNVNPGELAMRQMPESDLTRPLDMSPPEMSMDEFNREQAIQQGVNLNTPQPREVSLEEFNRAQAEQQGVNLNSPESMPPPPPPLASPWGAGSEVPAHPLDRAKIAQGGAPEPPLDLRYAAMAERMALFKEEMKRREDAKRQNLALNKRRNAGAIDYSPLR